MIWIANHLNYQRRWAYQIFTHIIQLAESFPVTVILFPHIQEIFSTYNLFNFENNWVIWVIAFSCLFVRTLKPWFPDTENKLFPDLWLALQAVVGLFVYSDGIKSYSPGQIYLASDGALPFTLPFFWRAWSVLPMNLKISVSQKDQCNGMTTGRGW